MTEEKRHLQQRRQGYCLLLNAPSSKSWRIYKKIPKRVLRACFASRRNERGLGINEETALLSQWQLRFKVDRMQSRFASSADLGPCQPARRREERSLVAAALSKIDAGVALLVREVGVALLLRFCSRRRDIHVYLLSLLRAGIHVFEIGRVPLINNVRNVSYHDD